MPVTQAPRSVLVAHPGAALYGSDRMVLESVRGLLDAGMAVTLVLPGTGPLAELAAGFGARVVSCPTPVLRKGALTPAGLLRLLGAALAGTVRGAALLRRHRVEVVYVSTLTVPLWVLLGRLTGRPVVCHVHEAESGAARWLRRALAMPLLAATAVLANSRYAVDVVAGEFGSIRDRARVLPNGVAPPPTVIPARPAPDGPLRVLYLGRLSERKGVDVLLDSVVELLGRGLGLRLDLVGDVFADHARFADRLDARIQAPPLAGRVVRHGFQDDIWPHLAGCDLLVVPSVLPEPFGNTAVEGVLAARPVLASDIGGLPEALAGFDSGCLVPPGNADALADAIEAAAKDYPQRAGQAAADARLAAARYDPMLYRAGVVEAVRAVRPEATAGAG